MIVYEPHVCRRPRGALHVEGTIWRCDECGRAWFRNYNQVNWLWSPVRWWHFRKRRLARGPSTKPSEITIHPGIKEHIR